MSLTNKLTIRLADGTRKAEVDVPTDLTGSDLVQSAVTNWQLPSNNSYQLVNITRGCVITPNDTLGVGKVAPGDTLELQPVLVAGRF
jgi:hypothetical protein